MRFAPFFLLLSFFPLLAAGAQTAGTPAGAAGGTATGPDLSVPKDPSASWNVGFSVFATENLSPENAYLAYSIPLLLRDQVSGISRHSLSEDERVAVRALIASRALSTAEDAITAARRDHDAMLFATAATTDAARSSLGIRIKNAEARRDALKSLDSTQIEVTEEKPVTFVEGKGEGKLLDAPLVPASVYCARQGLDLLVGGSILEIQGYLLVDIWAYEAAADTMIISTREAAQREDIYADMEALGGELTGAVLGREWSIVAFAPSPPESSLYVDGTLVASGASPALFLEPGDREIRITAPGYGEVTRTLSLEPGKPAKIDDTLQQSAPGTISLSTDPPGAALHIDSLWAGLTPVVIDTPPQRSRGVLELDGYYPAPLSLGPGTPSTLSLTLQPDTGPRDARQSAARDAFYSSFGWFAASIPIPLFSYALISDFGYRYLYYLENGQATDAPGAYSAYNGFTAAYYGGVALSAGLFIWMITRIIQYVTVANGIAG